MFTGIISELGTVVDVLPNENGRRLTVDAHETAAGLRIGESVSINGVCLTVVGRNDETFTVEVVRESIDRTTLGELEMNSRVNLERPLSSTGRFDGHIVQGHVDGVGIVTRISPEGDASRIRIEVPVEVARYIVEKGSITLDGTSLTVSALSETGAAPAWVEVVLIPHTLAVTVFASRQRGSRINLEVDVIAKYVERLMGARA